MAVAETRADNDGPGTRWLDIDDFTPGCYSYSYNAYEIDRVPAPLGAADAFNTWCCSALPTGASGRSLASASTSSTTSRSPA